SGDRGDDGDLRPVGDLGLQSLLETHVLVTDVDVDEAADLAVLVEDAGADTGVVGLQVVDDLGKGVALGGDLGDVVGVGAQAGGHADAGAHGVTSFLRFLARGWWQAGQNSPAAVNASRDGSSVAVTPASTASSVLRPSPVLSTTVSVFGSSLPLRISLRRTPAVTPPAVSAKMPSVRARRLMASTISSSPTCSTEDRKSTRLNSSHVSISYAVFCLKKKKYNKLNIILLPYHLESKKRLVGRVRFWELGSTAQLLLMLLQEHQTAIRGKTWQRTPDDR